MSGCFVTKHGMSGSNEHAIWKSMRGRCKNRSHTSYPRYGAVGVRVCPDWEDFEVFLRDVGPRPSKDHSLERLDNSKGYEPGNVVWAGRERQANNKRNNRRFVVEGVSLTIAEISRKYGIPYPRLYARLIRFHHSVEKALRHVHGNMRHSAP